MKIEQTSLTPADAAKLLEKNSINRKLSRQRGAALTAIIERDEWQFDGNPIKIAEDGTVLDGQHRLHGIADAQVESVPVILITGMPSDARMVVDSGRSRSFADYLDLKGVPNSLSMAAAVRGVWNYSHGLHEWRGNWMQRPVPSYPQLWELYLKRQSSFEEAISQANKVLRVVRTARATAATAWIVLEDVTCPRCGPVLEDRAEFFEQLTMSSAGPISDGAMTFTRLMNRRGQSDGPGRVVYPPTTQLALLLKAWNAFREGRPVTTLMWKRGGKTPEKFPIPH